MTSNFYISSTPHKTILLTITLRAIPNIRNGTISRNILLRIKPAPETLNPLITRRTPPSLAAIHTRALVLMLAIIVAIESAGRLRPKFNSREARSRSTAIGDNAVALTRKPRPLVLSVAFAVSAVIKVDVARAGRCASFESGVRNGAGMNAGEEADCRESEGELAEGEHI